MGGGQGEVGEGAGCAFQGFGGGELGQRIRGEEWDYSGVEVVVEFYADELALDFWVGGGAKKPFYVSNKFNCIKIDNKAIFLLQ